jgi:hypothetical protein
MSFVFPALLGGLVVAGVPVLLHLIMRQKPKTLRFPAFRFLVQRQRTNLRKLRLRHLLLLALRVLLIALMCLALGRPRLFNEELGLSSERPVAAVLVFDTSLSMEYQTSDKRSRLTEAKKRGQEFLAELPEGSRIIVLDTADLAGTSRGDWLASRSQVQGRINGLLPRPASGSVLQTLEYAYRLLGDLARSREDDTSRFLPRLVCVFSDRTRGCWDLSKLPAAQNAADQVPPTLEGLQRVRDKIAPLSSLLRELRGKLPPPSGRDYPEQALIDSLEQLAPLLPGLTKADLPPDEKISALTATIKSRGRDLLLLVQPQGAKEKDDEFRAKLNSNLEAVLADLRGARGLFVDVGVDQPVDVALTRIELPQQANGQPRQLFGPEETIRLAAVAQATGKNVDTTITCKMDNKIYQQRPAQLKAGQRQSIPFEVDCKGLKPGPHQVEISMEAADLLPFNNRFYLTFAVEEPRRVLVLREDADAAKAQEFFIRALESNKFAVDVTSPQNFRDAGDHHAVYLFEVPAPDRQLWAKLRDVVERGIGLGVIPPGDEINIDAYNQEAAQKLLPGPIAAKITLGKDDGKSPGAIWNFDDEGIYQHLFMRPFRQWKENDLIREPRQAFAYWAVQPQGRESSVIVFYKDKDKHPALLERRFGAGARQGGKVLLFTTRLDAATPRWNNYAEYINSMFLVLAGRATSYLAGEAEAPKLNFLAGRDEPAVVLPPSARFAAYTVKGPHLAPQIPAPERQADLKLPQAETPGNYTLEPADKAGAGAVAAFSVNVPEEESDLSRVPASEVEALLGAGGVIAAEQKADIRDLLKAHWSEPLELFPLILVVLLLTLAVENLLANKFYRGGDEGGLMARQH